MTSSTACIPQPRRIKTAPSLESTVWSAGSTLPTHGGWRQGVQRWPGPGANREKGPGPGHMTQPPEPSVGLCAPVSVASFLPGSATGSCGARGPGGSPAAAGPTGSQVAERWKGSARSVLRRQTNPCENCSPGRRGRASRSRAWRCPRRRLIPHPALPCSVKGGRGPVRRRLGTGGGGHVPGRTPPLFLQKRPAPVPCWRQALEGLSPHAWGSVCETLEGRQGAQLRADGQILL